MNRLSKEKSPYLLMHSENPVDWYPWGAQAFDAASRTDKPIFLSIGYSSCHWCHVIAHESFEDEEIAAVLNADFICVKVDKEERPDVDAVYMDAVEIATGSGGWPMTLLITPDGAPFFAATYVPKGPLKALIMKAADMWRNDRASLQMEAEDFTDRMRAVANRSVQPMEISAALTERAAREYRQIYDGRYGGFGRAPKFPSAHNLLFLMAHYERTGDNGALAMVEKTLSAMARGGIFDQIGGGFCRYSVDQKWLIPHFEKMLYDNALILWAYADAWRITGNAFYRQMTERTAEYVLREMTGPDGEFYSAQDADSEGEEGAFYVFTRGEIENLLGREDAELFSNAYGITQSGNFEGKSVPNMLESDSFGVENERLSALRERVYRYRLERMRLGRDDKVLASWNALMICALCEAARAMDEPKYLSAARRADEFISARLIKNGDLLLRYRDGEAKENGVLADYAYLALARTELFESTGDKDCLKRAEALCEAILDGFSDAEHGGFYLYSDRAEQLVTRPKDTWDAAMPSGNSSAALAFLRLARQTGSSRWRDAAQRQLRYLSGVANERPTGHGFALFAISQALTKDS